MPELFVDTDFLERENRVFKQSEVPLPEKAMEYLARHAPGLTGGGYFCDEASKATSLITEEARNALDSIDTLLTGTCHALRDSIKYYRTTDEEVAKQYDRNLEVRK